MRAKNVDIRNELNSLQISWVKCYIAIAFMSGKSFLLKKMLGLSFKFGSDLSLINLT